jgi:hypothetical protein
MADRNEPYEPILELEDDYEADVSGWVLAWLVVCAVAGPVFIVLLLLSR